MAKDEIEILLVEDDAADMELTMRALRHDKLAGRIQVVRDGEEALDCLFRRGAYSARGFDQPPSLVLLDFETPQTVWTRSAARGQVRSPHESHSRSHHDLAQSYRLGVNSYVQKSVDFRLFEERVKQVGLYWLHVNEPPPPDAFLME